MGENSLEVLHSPEGHHFGLGRVGLAGNGLGSIGNYIDVRQYKCAGDFAEEGGPLVVGFDQGEVNVRRPDLQGKGGESGAGADVDDARRTGWRPAHRKMRDEWSIRRISRCGCREEVAGQE